MKAEVQEKESRSVQQSMAKLNLGVSRATREGIRKIGRLDRRGALLRERAFYKGTSHLQQTDWDELTPHGMIAIRATLSIFI